MRYVHSVMKDRSGYLPGLIVGALTMEQSMALESTGVPYSNGPVGGKWDGRMVLDDWNRPVFAFMGPMRRRSEMFCLAVGKSTEM